MDWTSLPRHALFPNESFHGKLTFIYPHVDEATRTVTVRFELENPDHKLRPGSTATVTLKVRPKDLPLFSTLKRQMLQNRPADERRTNC